MKDHGNEKKVRRGSVETPEVGGRRVTDCGPGHYKGSSKHPSLEVKGTHI